MPLAHRVPRPRRHARALLAVVLVGAGLSAGGPWRAAADGAPPPCAEPVLVLTAMPLELNPLLAPASLDPDETVRIDGRTFYGGRLAGNDVVVAMTRIGMVNAEQTATLALDHFRCPFRAVVFSGVAGSRFNIGDVTVPARWTRDGGASWLDADAAMVAVAGAVASAGGVELTRDVPVGDAACLCPGVDAATPVHLPNEAKIVVGGDGVSSGAYGGHALPCVPGGGDVFGCEPCFGRGSTLGDADDFASHAPDLADPAFITDFFQPPEQTTDTFDAQDQESAAVADVARRYGVPFLAVRAASDGQGDPLHLPGFPAQFFTYRQLAADNAAALTVAFLQEWAAQGRPTA